MDRISIDKKVQIVTQSVKLHADNKEHIDKLLKSLGGAYEDLAETKRPLIDNNSINTELLSALKASQYISSYSPDSKIPDKYRVVPRRRRAV